MEAEILCDFAMGVIDSSTAIFPEFAPEIEAGGTTIDIACKDKLSEVVIVFLVVLPVDCDSKHGTNI